MLRVLLAACTLFPTLLVTVDLQPPTVNFGTQKRDTAIRDLLVLRNYCKNGFFCENYEHCCPDGWGCCASSLFFPTLRLHFHSQLIISQMVAAASVSQGEYLLALKSINSLEYTFL
jgi:hypothetical protein